MAASASASVPGGGLESHTDAIHRRDYSERDSPNSVVRRCPTRPKACLLLRAMFSDIYPNVPDSALSLRPTPGMSECHIRWATLGRCRWGYSYPGNRTFAPGRSVGALMLRAGELSGRRSAHAWRYVIIFLAIDMGVSRDDARRLMVAEGSVIWESTNCRTPMGRAVLTRSDTGEFASEALTFSGGSHWAPRIKGGKAPPGRLAAQCACCGLAIERTAPGRNGSVVNTRVPKSIAKVAPRRIVSEEKSIAIANF